MADSASRRFRLSFPSQSSRHAGTRVGLSRRRGRGTPCSWSGLSNEPEGLEPSQSRMKGILSHPGPPQSNSKCRAPQALPPAPLPAPPPRLPRSAPLPLLHQRARPPVRCSAPPLRRILLPRHRALCPLPHRRPTSSRRATPPWSSASSTPPSTTTHSSSRCFRRGATRSYRATPLTSAP